jgi:hypothetical protein
MQENITSMDSRVYGELTVDIEGIGNQTVRKIQGTSVVGIVNTVGAALTLKPFSASPEEWEAGFDSANRTVILRRRK